MTIITVNIPKGRPSLEQRRPPHRPRCGLRRLVDAAVRTEATTETLHRLAEGTRALTGRPAGPAVGCPTSPRWTKSSSRRTGGRARPLFPALDNTKGATVD
ncbi:hypothetical protein [Streptomyces sp. NPDC127033]|uniref:hypothetical protein n=1 Tax=Streptomyces sp. NPDC127033 TaxID=3347110 RepID=UPI003666D047